MCFQNTSSDLKELNFNELKACSNKLNNNNSQLFDKHVVIKFSEDNCDDNNNNNMQKHKFQELHSEKPTLKIEFIYKDTNEKTSHDAHVLKVFNEKYVPKVRLSGSNTTTA